MGQATINLVYPVTLGIGIVMLVFAGIIEMFAFVHCLFQRRDAFNAVSTLPKGLWLALTLGGLFLSVVLGVSPVNLLGMVGVVASAVYLLDVRPAIRDVVDGGGPW